MPRLLGSIGEFVDVDPTRQGRNSAVPTRLGTVFVPADAADEACIVIRVSVPAVAADARFKDGEPVIVEFTERDDDWRYQGKADA
jgi:hypothetical protein